MPDQAAGPLTREFLDRPAVEVAPELLGCVLERETAGGIVAVVLTEVEAYAGVVDPASHAYRGRTARNAVMFGSPGHAYVYFTYGMHFCVNVVCQPPGVASAVLLRAGRVIAGEDLARRRRAVRRGTAAGIAGADGFLAPPTGGAVRDLARGPARLCQALAIDRTLDGADLCDPASPLRLETRGRSEETITISTGPRVGVREAADVPWRFWFAGEPSVSLYRPYAPRRR